MLADKSVSVRISVVNALGCLRNKQAVPSLIQLLRNRKSGMRIQAAQALGKIGDSASLEALRMRQNERITGLELQVIDNTINYLETNNM